MIVHVTQDLIKPIGDPSIPVEIRNFCPIKRAFIRAGVGWVSVGVNNISLQEKIDDIGVILQHSEESKQFVKDFDLGRPVQEITIDTEKLVKVKELWQA